MFRGSFTIRADRMESCYFRCFDRCRRRYFLPSGNRVGGQEAYKDPGIREVAGLVGWLSGRMNPDPRDKTREARLWSPASPQLLAGLPRSRVRGIAPSLSSFSLLSPFLSAFFLYPLFSASSMYPCIYPPLPPLFPSGLRDVTPAGFLPRQRFQDNRRTMDNRASQSVSH